MFFSKYKKAKNSNPFVIKEGESRHGSVEGFSYRLGWAEDSFISGKEEKETLGRSFNFKKIYFVVFTLLLFFGILFLRTAWLQIGRGDYYRSMAEGNRIRNERIEPRRGIIYDNERNPLVRNAANFLLYIIPADLPKDQNNSDSILKEVADILGDNNLDEIRAGLNKIKKGSLESYRPFFIADNIPYEKAMLLYLKSAEWQGVALSNKTRREYNLTSLSMAHLLGYTGKISEQEMAKYGDDYSPIDYIGKMGLENFYESELRGKNGEKQIEVDALGKEKKILSESQAEDGKNIVLSIDSGLQKKMEEVINAYIEKEKLKKAVGIAMNPNNGEILAMVSLPAFDNNVFAKGIKAAEYKKISEDPDRPLFNRAISGEYPSGSIIKPVMAAAALEQNIVNENTSFESVGGIRIGQWFFPDWKAGGHGTVNLKRAIAESVNTYFYYIGGGYQNFVGLGVDRIVAYDKRFGLSSQTGIDLPNEADGFLPSKEWKEKTKGEKWYIGDTYHLSIGQGDLLVTPLQVANYTSVFANGGSLYRPHLVKEILSPQDKVMKEIKEDPVKKDFIKPENIKIIREAMRQTVTAGSARRLAALPVEVAGKTGTAQWSSDTTNAHAWFTGFAPYENPEIVITILVEEGKGGDIIAVPITNDILAWYFGGRK